ncbi:MAG: hypothetical protein GY752_12040 [bacterium]|nr:hypothetical protein [bacterium]MCP4798404.1 hypothetical protein [bacterium]
MNLQRHILPVLGILCFGLVVVGCSNNPTIEEDPVVLSAWLAETTIVNGGSVAVSYELTGGVDTQWVMAQFVEPSGDVSVAGFQGEATIRHIGPLLQAGEYSIFVRALTEDDLELSTSPLMFFTVLEE